MDFARQLALTRQIVDIDSTTGREGEAGACLARLLRDLGWTVTEQPVSEGRFNVIASVGDPLVVFSTHFDCVPPFFASRVENGRLHGRGACDAGRIGRLAAKIPLAGDRALLGLLRLAARLSGQAWQLS